MTMARPRWIRNFWTGWLGEARPWYAKPVILALVGLLAWTSLLPNTRTAPVFGDEVGWISVSSYTSNLVLSGRFERRFWDTDSFGAWGPMNPPVGKLALGLPLRIGTSDPAFRGTWDWSLNEAENRLQGNLPSPELLQTARRIAASYAALLVVVVCALGWRVGGASLGLLAAGLLILHPTWRGAGSLVLTDMLLCTTVLSMAFPAMRLLGRGANHRALVDMACLGLLVGLAGAIKPTGLVIGGLFLATLLAYRVVSSRRVLPHVAGALVAAALAGTTLVALDPWLWPDPKVANPVELFREVPVAIDALTAANPVAALQAHRAKLAGIESLARPAFLIVRAQRWKQLVATQRTLPELQWKGPRLLVLLEWVLFRLGSFPGQFLFVLVGIWSARRVFRTLPGDAASINPANLVPILMAIATSIYTVFFVVLPVPRYILPLLLPLQLLAAQGVLVCLGWARSRLRRVG